MAGVVRPACAPTTPRRLAPALPLLVQGGEHFLVLISLCIDCGAGFREGNNGKAFIDLTRDVGSHSLMGIRAS